ncbi:MULTISPECIES: DUF4255 domain-containing protein [Photorhabdus]|uniref:Pvc16 N-terminal domain-containing protein n=2 Tax=Photorhabdus asymbiotica TaxID=291112 RepID=C7BKQ0_PHOAA|nr:DUF4255 domain-containing protein [Photorhabdus asymbiotica]RKS65790.1 uncharacterized protein DUF4255 [Photorhabdus asymbiotica]CAQ84323.1 conserved hypothetical protein [Photorhabdus asymbiotica]
MVKNIKSDETLLILNSKIEDALKAYLPGEDVVIRFDMFGKNENPDSPTVCVFLYDIQEDLQLRVGEGRQYLPATGNFVPGCVNVRCNYLISYWEPEQSGGQGSPTIRSNSQSMKIMNCVLNALINHRSFPGLPRTYTRVLPPNEQLNSLGNFWQSLDNKPRLCLSYMVTIPIQLTPPTEKVSPVITSKTDITRKPSLNFYLEADEIIRQALVDALISQTTESMDTITSWLAKVVIICRPPEIMNKQMIEQTVKLIIAGITEEGLAGNIKTITQKWVEEKTIIGEIDDVSLVISQVDTTALSAVTIPTSV